MKNTFLLLVYIPLILTAQIKDSVPLELDDYILVKTGDTLTIALEEFTVLPKHDFNSAIDARYYYWFQRKVFKVYPFAKTASQRLDSLNARLGRINSKSRKRNYTKRAQKYLEGEFTDQLKKMINSTYSSADK